MSNIIDSIQLSGTVYTLSAQTSGGSGATVSEVTQAQYDELVSGGTVDPTVLYIITDAQPVDISQYMTSAQTMSAITQAVSGKANSSDVYTKSETSGATEIATALSGKQDTLSAGTNITIVDNVISASGGGMTEDDELLLSTALVDLNERKIDASEVKYQLGNYQKKGDYVTTSTLNTRLAEYETALDEQNVEEVTAYALNDLNDRFGGLRLVKLTESEYTALTNKDDNTLYVVVADPT